MGKALRVLIIFIFLLGVGALVFAWMLYTKRLEFSERFTKFHKTLEALAKFIEREAPAKTTGANYEERDISDVTPREVVNPQRFNFWDNYVSALEETPSEMFVWGSNEQTQIKKLFLTELDAGGNERKVLNTIDPQINKYVTEGPGTMQELLNKIVARTAAQYNTLIETREQLKRLREEYNKTVLELNSRKKEGRTDKKTIEDLNNEKDRLEGEIVKLNKTISDLQQDIKEKEIEIAEWKEKFNDKQKEFDDLKLKTEQFEAQVVQLKIIIDNFTRDPTKGIGGPGNEIRDDEWRKYLPPGDVGVVLRVDNDLKFVVVQLDESFCRLGRVLGENLDKEELEGIPLSIRRPGFESPSGEFITRIRLRQVSREKFLFVADILADWQQSPVEVGDVVFSN